MDAKELALNALKANQEHQYALAGHAHKLDAELAELDKLLAQADVADDESDVLESDFYIPNSKSPAGLIRNFLHPDSPFYEDAMKRTRYLELTARPPLSPKEIEALKAAVDAELKRVEQLEGTSSSTTDSQMAGRLNWIIIAEKVSDTAKTTRTPDECRIKWIGDLSPSINRGTWAAAETQRLQQILQSKSPKRPVDWVEVARELGTNRLPIECMRQGFDRPRHVWTVEFDQKLLDAVEQYGSAWSLVAKYVSPDVAPATCHSRWTRNLDPSLRRGAWTADEDVQLRAAVAGYGKASWVEVASALPGRNNTQCRDRWAVLGDPVRVVKRAGEGEGWSAEEERRLVRAVFTVGRKWKEIGLRMGKSANECRIYYDKLPKAARAVSPSALNGSKEDGDEEEDNDAPASKESTLKPPAKKAPARKSNDSRPKPRPLTRPSGGTQTKRGAREEEMTAEEGAAAAKQPTPPSRPKPRPLRKKSSAAIDVDGLGRPATDEEAQEGAVTPSSDSTSERPAPKPPTPRQAQNLNETPKSRPNPGPRTRSGGGAKRRPADNSGAVRFEEEEESADEDEEGAAASASSRPQPRPLRRTSGGATPRRGADGSVAVRFEEEEDEEDAAVASEPQQSTSKPASPAKYSKAPPIQATTSNKTANPGPLTRDTKRSRGAEDPDAEYESEEESMAPAAKRAKRQPAGSGSQPSPSTAKKGKGRPAAPTQVSSDAPRRRSARLGVNLEAMEAN